MTVGGGVTIGSIRPNGAAAMPQVLNRKKISSSPTQKSGIAPAAMP